MKHQFTVDGLVYQLHTDNLNEIRLAIIGGASPTFCPEPDPFDWEYVPYITSDIGTIRYPVRVLRTALRLVENWIGGQRPSNFRFRAETQARYSLYARVANNLSAKFPYQLAEEDGQFFFYRRAPKQNLC